MDPVPTLHSDKLVATPSVLPTTQTTREPPRERIFQLDQLESFQEQDKIQSVDELNQSHSPPGFGFRKFENSVVYYRLHFDESSQFPSVLESIRIDSDLHVQLQYNGIPLPLPPWFINGRNALLNKHSILLNFPAYIRTTATENQQLLLDELKQRELYKPRGRPPFSASMIRFALHLRHTSLQAYKLLLEKFPMPSLSLLTKIQVERTFQNSYIWFTFGGQYQTTWFFPNPLGNAIVLNDGKTNFFRHLAFWVQEFSQSPAFTFTAQTPSALINTLRSQAMLIDELLEDGYDYVMTGRLQSDPIECRFSQYRQMSGGRFLVSLREVLNTERILKCRSLIKEDINFWKENLKPISEDYEDEKLNLIDEALQGKGEEIFECVLDDASSEVATTISGYIVKKLIKRTKCDTCKQKLTISSDDLQNDEYLRILSRGGLIVPPKELAEFVCTCFAILDFVENDILSVDCPVTKS
ncbi:MAG: hypothetical protein AAFY76_07890, partial [Cyanobacteria bacterium J06649_11]